MTHNNQPMNKQGLIDELKKAITSHPIEGNEEDGYTFRTSHDVTKIAHLAESYAASRCAELVAELRSTRTWHNTIPAGEVIPLAVFDHVAQSYTKGGE